MKDKKCKICTREKYALQIQINYLKMENFSNRNIIYINYH
jgi:hypothetical protein